MSVAGETAGSVYFDGHQCHQWTVAPPALDQMVRFLCISHQMRPFYNARNIFPQMILGSSQKGRKRPQKEKDSGLVCIWSTSTHGGGVTKMGTL